MKIFSSNFPRNFEIFRIFPRNFEEILEVFSRKIFAEFFFEKILKFRIFLKFREKFKIFSKHFRKYLEKISNFSRNFKEIRNFKIFSRKNSAKIFLENTSKISSKFRGKIRKISKFRGKFEEKIFISKFRKISKFRDKFKIFEISRKVNEKA